MDTPVRQMVGYTGLLIIAYSIFGMAAELSLLIITLGATKLKAGVRGLNLRTSEAKNLFLWKTTLRTILVFVLALPSVAVPLGGDMCFATTSQMTGLPGRMVLKMPFTEESALLKSTTTLTFLPEH